MQTANASPKAARLIRPLVGDKCERVYVYDPSPANEASGLEVVLRPVTGDHAAAYMMGDPLTQISRAAVLWEKHGVGWNVADPDAPKDTPPESWPVAPVTAANFLRLPYPAQVWLADMLLGYGTKPRPGSAVTAAVAATMPPTTEQEDSEKN